MLLFSNNSGKRFVYNRNNATPDDNLDTHIFINNQAIKILFADGYISQAQILRTYQVQLNEGALGVDKGMGKASHHYNPLTRTGLWKWPTAYDKCCEYIQEAKINWLNAKYEQGAFLLGEAAHLVQDVCVPHHTTCKVFGGHVKYEKWVKKHKADYAVEKGGIYDLGASPGEWVHSNALIAMPYLKMVTANNSEINYDLASKILLKRAQRSTAGFLLRFLNTVTLSSDSEFNAESHLKSCPNTNQ